jgi:hypothetical protein
MDIHDLQSVLRERADGPGVGSPDIDALLGKGQALRRRRRTASAAVAAVIVAALVAIPMLAFGGSNSDGAPATIIPAASASPTPTQSAASPTPSTTGPVSSASATIAPVAPASVLPALPSAPASTVAPPVDSSTLVYGNCQTPSFEPSEIVLTCADNGLLFVDLQWSSWTANSATAIGTEMYKDCIPNCAEGHFRSFTGATVTLTAPVTDPAGRLVWSKIAFAPQPPGYATGPFHGGVRPLPVNPD